MEITVSGKSELMLLIVHWVDSDGEKFMSNLLDYSIPASRACNFTQKLKSISRTGMSYLQEIK